MTLPVDYEQRVYAGVLGKIIGIYFGLPMEGMTREQIVENFGAIDGYTHENPKNRKKVPMPLVNTSDDINGMFTFIRALSDNENRKDISAADIGRTWLNNFILGKTATWWAGMCYSTEHTAMIRLLAGIEAPESGSIKRNGHTTAEQIGGRIFIDAWPMVAPGDPGLAVDLARKAASVSHDGEGIYGALIVAAMESQAFVESDLNKLFDTGLEFIPKESTIHEVTQNVRNWHAGDGDWERTLERIQKQYGYGEYGGGCHIVPNHALVVLGLLYGDNDFKKSLTVTASAGWDTDCNCSAVGCLLGIKDGLATLDAAPELREPVEDRLYTSTADSGRSITDAVIESYHIINIGRSFSGQEPLEPKNGARFHFELPGSVQCFRSEVDGDSGNNGKGGKEKGAQLNVENVEGFSEAGQRSLALRYQASESDEPLRVSAETYKALAMNGTTPKDGWLYRLISSPTLYSGQTVHARITADPGNSEPVRCGLFLREYVSQKQMEQVGGPSKVLEPGESHVFAWIVPDSRGRLIGEIGMEITAQEEKVSGGALYLDYLSWDGAPNIVFRDPRDQNQLFRLAWAPAITRPQLHEDSFHLRQNLGKGLMIQGTRDWKDYAVSAIVSAHWAKNVGIGARAQGARRYYALLLGADQRLRIVKMLDTESVLAEVEFSWEGMVEYELRLEVEGNMLTGLVNGKKLLEVTDDHRPLLSGGAAMVLEEGHLRADAIAVTPLDVHEPLAQYRRTDGQIEFIPKPLVEN